MKSLASATTVGGNTSITLADNTRVTFTGVTSLAPGKVLGF